MKSGTAASSSAALDDETVEKLKKFKVSETFQNGTTGNDMNVNYLWNKGLIEVPSDELDRLWEFQDRYDGIVGQPATEAERIAKAEELLR